MKNSNADNFLDYKPGKRPPYDKEVKSAKAGPGYMMDESGNIIILMENKGAMKKLTQLLFFKPRISQIHMEEMGSFIWPLIDGKTDVFSIGQQVKERFGEKAEPLYPRLCQYIKTLEDNGFVNLC